MIDRDRIMIAILARDEELRIGSTVTLAKRYAENILVIDDGSKDQTALTAESAGAYVIRHRKPHGRRWAIDSAFKSASKIGARILFVYDTDSKVSIHEIPSILKRRKNEDVLIGDRFEGPKEAIMPANVKEKGAFYSSRYDTRSPLWCFSKRAFELRGVKEIKKDVGSGIMIKAHDKGLKVSTIPLKRSVKRSTIRSLPLISPLYSVLRFLWKLATDKHPLIVFSLPGIVIFFTGLIFGMNEYLDYRNHVESLYIGPVILSTLLMLTGLFLAYMGLILNSISNIIMELRR